MFWRAVVRDFGVGSEPPKRKWERDQRLLLDSFRSLLSGKSWSGSERNHLFLGDGKDFVRVTGISGADDPGDSRGFAVLDFDRDGDLDIALTNLSSPRMRLLRNDANRKGNGFVAVRFVGGNHRATPSEEFSARDGYGASVELILDDGTKIYREHRTEDGYMTQHSSTMLIGVGQRKVKSVRVQWPSGKTQTRSNVDGGSLLTATERGRITTAPYR
ncbi:MAG: CRTAC1 family protein [Planctomycetota bacterium]